MIVKLVPAAKARPQPGPFRLLFIDSLDFGGAERHHHVLVRRYGLDDRDPATLAELGDELKSSRERVRQLQCEAERMLSSGGSGSTLRDAAA